LPLQKKGTKEKESGKDNLGLFVRPLHKAVLAPPNSPRFAPFPGSLRTFTRNLLLLKLSFGFAELVTLRVPRFRRPFSLVRFFLDEQKEMNI